MLHNPPNNRIDTLQSVEMAEGVEVKTPVAGAFPRAMALLLDSIFMMLLFFAFVMLLVFLLFNVFHFKGGGEVIGGIFLITLFIFIWFYNFFFERGKKAATWGKRIYGLKVVSIDGTRATGRQIFVRNILRAADYLPGVPLYLLLSNEDAAMLVMATGVGMIPVGSYGIGLFSCLFTKRFQRVGDLVANTVVIHTKTQVHAVSPIKAPDLPKMPRLQLIREEEVAIRSFCERAGIWSEERRIEMAQHAEELTQKQGVEAVEELAAYSRWIVDRS